MASTHQQYQTISGNWPRYLSRLANKKGREGITRADLLRILKEQDYRCALSGIPLTCNLEVGKRFGTNASIDRIEAGGEYTPENIQLVCACINGFRGGMSIQEFIEVCKKVVSHTSGT